MPNLRRITPLARISAAAIAFIALASILLRIGLYLGEGEQLAAVTWWLMRFFTILTNLLVAGTFARIALGHGIPPRWVLAMTAAIAGVGIVYHVALAHLLTHEGWEIAADQGVHTAVPILTVLWFFAFMPKVALDWRHVPLVVIWPAIYTLYALLRGAAEGEYPYFFLDAGKLGPVELAINIVGLSLFFATLGALLVWGLKLRGGRSIAA